MPPRKRNKPIRNRIPRSQKEAWFQIDLQSIEIDAYRTEPIGRARVTLSVDSYCRRIVDFMIDYRPSNLGNSAFPLNDD